MFKYNSKNKLPPQYSLHMAHNAPVKSSFPFVRLYDFILTWPSADCVLYQQIL